MGGSVAVATRSLSNTPYCILGQEIATIPYLSIPLRKDILTLCRVQSHPTVNARLSQAFKKSLHYPPFLHPVDKTTWIHPSRIINSFATACHNNPVFSGYLSMLVRSLPFYGAVDGDEERRKSVIKEFIATQGRDREQVLNYDVWFNELEAIERPLSQFLPSRPELNQEIRDLFARWKRELGGIVIFPQFSVNRSMGRETARNLLRDMGYTNEDVMFASGLTTGDLEKWYMRTGRQCRGPCEMRVVWRFNDLKARTYFAPGGDTYWASRYIRPVINRLADSFPMSAFRTRMTTSRLSAPLSSRMFIYDYTSFTSNLAEFKYFLSNLAEYCRGTSVYLLDTFLGVVEIDLGQLIDEYNEHCNLLPAFSMERLWEGEELFFHKLAGFLGVYGNITGCTTLHGLHACQICGSMDRCNCVGDDVIAIQEREDMEFQYAVKAVRSLGDVAEEKFECWETGRIEENETGWQFLKRPLDRFQTRVIAGRIFDFPILGAIFPERDGVHDDVVEEDLSVRLRALASQTMSLLDRALAYKDDLTAEDKEFILNVLEQIYRRLSLPFIGSLPGDYLNAISSNGLILPPIIPDCFSRSWMDVLVELHQGEVSSLPVTISRCDMRNYVGDFVEGDVRELPVCRVMALCRKLGLVETTLLEEFHVVDASYRRKLEGLLCGELVSVYSVLFVKKQHWWSDLSFIL